jgi:hypothetical protein
MQEFKPFIYCDNESVKESDYVYIVRYTGKVEGEKISYVDIVDFTTYEEQRINGKEIQTDSEPTYDYLRQSLIAKIKKADIDAIGKRFISTNECNKMIKSLEAKEF